MPKLTSVTASAGAGKTQKASRPKSKNRAETVLFRQHPEPNCQPNIYHLRAQRLSKRNPRIAPTTGKAIITAHMTHAVEYVPMGRP